MSLFLVAILSLEFSILVNCWLMLELNEQAFLFIQIVCLSLDFKKCHCIFKEKEQISFEVFQFFNLLS